MEDQEIFWKVLGKKIYNGLWSSVMAQAKFRWLHFPGLSNNRMLDPVFLEISGTEGLRLGMELERDVEIAT